MWMCWVTRRNLATYHDGQLNHRTTARLTAHLRCCAPCQRYVEERRRLDLWLHTLPIPSHPPDYWPQALARVRDNIRRHPRSSRWSLSYYCAALLENPARALIPAAMTSAALVQTLVFLGVEEEVLAFVATYLIPLVSM
jgi:anti-sigma factor RsiW